MMIAALLVVAVVGCLAAFGQGRSGGSGGGVQPAAYRLIGSASSYAQYLPWHPCLNGTLVFEFKTHEPNGLLLYAQSLPYKYMQLSLADGQLRLRMRIGEKDSPRGVFLVHALPGVRLNDEKWHEVRIARQNERTVLTVDGEHSSYHVHAEPGPKAADLYFGDGPAGPGSFFGAGSSATPTGGHLSSLLVFGGLPSAVQTFDLSLGTALFEPRFNGFVRNVRALNCSSPYLARLDVVSSADLIFADESDACTRTPCQNHGVCQLTDGGYVCDCSFTGHEGHLCEKLKPQRSSQELTFTGREYFSFEMPNGAAFATTFEEELALEFRTSRSTGLLVYAGDSHDYLVLGLQDGGLLVKLNMKGQVFERTLTIPGTYLHNNHWHSVRFSRRRKQVEVAIDGMKRESANLTGEFISMQTRAIYVAGVPGQASTYRAIRKNFIGCLRNVTFRSDTVSVDLVDKALRNESTTAASSSFVRRVGDLQKGCQQIMDPVTFTSPHTYIAVPAWKDYPRLYSFSIEFQTNENYGVLAYALGKENPSSSAASSSPVGSLGRDFFALEIHNRFLLAYFHLGGGAYVRHEVVHEHVSSGRAHQIHVEMNDKFASFRFDQRPETTIQLDAAPGDRLELLGPLVIGGLHPNHTTTTGVGFGGRVGSPSVRLPPYFYSGMLGFGFVGCVQDVEVNGELVNLTRLAAAEGVSGVSTDMCAPMPDQCDFGNCLNDGVCMEGWNRFVCDCSATGYNGPICNQPATIANFAHGQQHLRLRFDPEWVSEAEHLSLRFKTRVKQNSLLLSTHSAHSKDQMELALEGAQVRLSIRIGSAEMTLQSHGELDENEWHTVKVFREGPRIILQVDDFEPVTGMLQVNRLSQLHIFFGFVELGASIFQDNNKFLGLSDQKALSYSHLDLGGRSNGNGNNKQHRRLAPFHGQMQQLIINGRSYFELVDNGELPEQAVNRSGVLFQRADLPHKYPITFHDAYSWAELPRVHAQYMLLVQFHFKTSASDGLLLYNNGHAGDFIAVELVAGQLQYAFSAQGTAGVVRSRAREPLNDNAWHLVSIWRSSRSDHELSVDALVYRHSAASARAGSVVGDQQSAAPSLVDKLYVGGLRDVHEYGRLVAKGRIRSTHGFKGCLASFEVNGRAPDLEEVISPNSRPSNRSSGNITRGCESPHHCQQDTCKNGGVCLQRWDEVFCNCEFTTYTGKFCQTRSKGYQFEKGAVKFEYKSPLYWQEDNLVFGVETKASEAQLFRASSQRTNRTISVDLVDGYVHATYVDAYNQTHAHTFKKYPINDRKYHVVKLSVNELNSTLAVDNTPAKRELPPGAVSPTSKKAQPLLIHSDQSFVVLQVGGGKGQRAAGFDGNIYGLTFNTYKVFDYLAQNDPRIRREGQLTLLDMKPPPQSPQRENSGEDEDAGGEENGTLFTYTPPGGLAPEDAEEAIQETDSDKGPSVENPHLAEMTTTAHEQAGSSTLAPPPSPPSSTLLSDAATRDKTGLAATAGLNPPYNFGFIVGVAAASFFVLMLLIFAICKYRNRDEGTYRIDESKNFGPFAELDALNGGGGASAASKCKSASSNGKNRRKGVGVKEWYV